MWSLSIDAKDSLYRPRELCRGAAVEANTGAKAMASNKTIAAVANLARADARHVATKLNGRVDLKGIGGYIMANIASAVRQRLKRLPISRHRKR
jgi:hypothetical protein